MDLESLGGVPRVQKMLKGHLPRVMYHQAYQYTKTRFFSTKQSVGPNHTPLGAHVICDRHNSAELLAVVLCDRGREFWIDKLLV